MISVCIVDDDKLFLEQTKNYIEKVPKGIDYEITVYSESVDENIIDKAYMVYIFDIDMPNLNGFELAEKIQKEDKHAVFIFMSSHSNLVYSSFDFNAFYFVRKSEFDRDMDKAFSCLDKHLQSSKKKYICKQRNKALLLNYSDIIYFEKVRNSVTIVTTEFGQIDERRSMRSVLDEITSSEFFLINSGLYINFLNVQEFDEKVFIMKDGTRLEPSRRRVKESSLSYRKYLMEENH